MTDMRIKIGVDTTDIDKAGIPAQDHHTVVDLAKSLGPGMARHALNLYRLTHPASTSPENARVMSSLQTFTLHPTTLAKSARLHVQALESIGYSRRHAVELVTRIYRNRLGKAGVLSIDTSDEDRRREQQKRDEARANNRSKGGPSFMERLTGQARETGSAAPGQRRDRSTITVTLRDPDRSLVRLLKDIKDRANGGHSYEVVTDPEAGTKHCGRFGIDGDGPFCIEEIKENGEVVKALRSGLYLLRKNTRRCSDLQPQPKVTKKQTTEDAHPQKKESQTMEKPKLRQRWGTRWSLYGNEQNLIEDTPTPPPTPAPARDNSRLPLGRSTPLFQNPSGFDIKQFNGHQLAALKAGLSPNTPGIEKMSFPEMQALAQSQVEQQAAEMRAKRGCRY